MTRGVFEDLARAAGRKQALREIRDMREHLIREMRWAREDGRVNVLAYFVGKLEVIEEALRLIDSDADLHFDAQNTVSDLIDRLRGRRG